MPSHIDVLTGRWAEASEQNELAIRADRKYRGMSAKQGFYHLYMLHNHHMLSFASMMEGRCDVAIRSARQVRDTVPKEYLERNASWMDAYMGSIYDALKRFGLWDEILQEPAPPAYLPITTAHWRFHRGLAFAAKGEVRHALIEQAAFERAKDDIPEDAIMAINPAKTIMQIATHFLRGEIEFRRGHIDLAVDELHKAIELEDSLLYMEPPEWMQPTRHTLGAVLLSAGRAAEAETVYREDLANWPNNGWSLYGLGRSLRLQGQLKEAEQIEARFRESWSRADMPIASSCLCIPKT